MRIDSCRMRIAQPTAVAVCGGGVKIRRPASRLGVLVASGGDRKRRD